MRGSCANDAGVRHSCDFDVGDVSGSGILALKVPNRLVRLGEEVRQEPSPIFRWEYTCEPPKGILEWSDVQKVHLEQVSWLSPLDADWS